jgi:solute carrier family 13 (sodium-dependent dicarboxylate transporter), member 2/3/5
MSLMLTPAGRLLASLALAALVWLLAPADGTLRTGLALFTLIGALWMTQALHVTVTALLVPLLAILMGVLAPREALAQFANPIIFLFLGGFALAAALARHGLDRWLAVTVLRWAGGRRAVAVLLLFALTAFLSMWISNTATAAMMLPLALGLLGTDEEQGAATPTAEKMFVLLGLAYSASIGGIGTLVGSPPNAIAAAQADISFARWMAIGLPVVALLLPLMGLTLYLMLRPRLAGRIEVPKLAMAWTRERLTVVAIFALTVLGWVAGAPLARALGITADFDTVVALAAIAALCITGSLGWDDIEGKAHWGVLLLFGGGLTLSAVMGGTGASRFLAEQLVLWVQGASVYVLIFGVIAFVVMLTELVSNTASAALLVPLFLGVGSELGLPPITLSAGIAVAASCAFMLPVATPPNAIVFGTGLVPQSTMMRCGLALNLVCMVVVTAVIETLAMR